MVLSQSLGDLWYTVVGVNIKMEMVLSPNDEVANSSKKHNIPNSRLEGTNHTQEGMS